MYVETYRILVTQAFHCLPSPVIWQLASGSSFGSTGSAACDVVIRSAADQDGPVVRVVLLRHSYECLMSPI